MSTIIELPLIGGEDTSSEKEVVATGFTVNKNWVNPRKGKSDGALHKTVGFGGATTVSGHRIRNIVSWVSEGTQWFIGFDYVTNRIYRYNDSLVPQAETNPLGDPSDLDLPNIYNHGDVVRIAAGHSIDPKSYRAVDRDFFFANIDGGDTFQYGDAAPYDSLEEITESSIVYNSGWFELYGGRTGHISNQENAYLVGLNGTYSGFHDQSGAAADFYYGYSLLFDGVQESRLTKVGDTSSTKDATCVPVISITWNNGSSLADWNKRVTGINIYRSTSYEGTYNKIGSVSTIYDSGDAKFYSDGTNLEGDLVYIPDLDGWTQEGSSPYNAFYHPGTGTVGMPTEGTPFDNTTKLLSFATGDGEGTALHGKGWWSDPAIFPHWGFRYIIDIGKVGGGLTYYDKLVTCYQSSSTAGIDGNNAPTEALTSVTATSATTNNVAFMPENHRNARRFTGWNASGDGIIITKTKYRGETSSSTYVFADGDRVRIGFYARRRIFDESGSAGVTSAKALTAEQSQDALEEKSGSFKYTRNNGSTYHSLTPDHTARGEDGCLWTFYTATLYVESGREVWTRIKYHDGNLTALAGSSYASCELLVSAYMINLVDKEYRAYGFNMPGAIYSPSFNFGTTASEKGKLIMAESTPSTAASTSAMRGFIKSSTNKAILAEVMGENTTSINDIGATSIDMIISDNHQFRQSGNKIYFYFWDKGFTAGAAHSYQDTKLGVRYKYSALQKGRQFVANVLIDPEGDNETHANWVMFSEFNQPDVIPITNYIQLQDKQGGVITGIAQVLGDLVVFMERGIFRISVPELDPTSWSILEAFETIGCIAPQTIVEWEGGVFFAGQNNFYYIDPNFNLVPVGYSIRQVMIDETTVANIADWHAFVDDENKLLYVNFKENNETYSFNLAKYPNSGEWKRINLTTTGITHEGFLLDKDSRVQVYNKGAMNTTFRQLHPPSSSESVAGTFTSGMIRLADSGNTGMVRRLNARVTGNQSWVFTLKDTSGTIWTKTITPSGNAAVENISLKVGRRAELVEVTVSATGTSTCTIERVSLEID